MLGTYNPKESFLALGGVPTVGFARDSSISIVPNSETYEYIRGLNSTATRVALNDDSYVCTVTLDPSSPSLAQYSTLVVAGRNGDNDIVSFMFKHGKADPSGKFTVVKAREAFVLGDAEFNFSSSVDPVSYRILLHKAETFRVAFGIAVPLL